eukprot:Em0002g930a
MLTRLALFVAMLTISVAARPQAFNIEMADGSNEAVIFESMNGMDVTKQIADIVVGNTLSHFGGVHTIPTIGDPEYGVPKKFILTYGVVSEFTCKDYQPVHISVPAGRQLIVFSATYGSPSHSNNDVTRAVINNLVKYNAIDHEGGVHTAIGDPEVGVPKTFRLVYGYSERFTCSDYQPVVVSVEMGFSLHVFRATYGSANY